MNRIDIPSEEINSFIKDLIEINNTMKKVFSNKVNYQPTYIFDKGKLAHYDFDNYIPYIHGYVNEDNINSPSLLDLSFVVENSKDLYVFLRDNKKTMKEIFIIENDQLVFVNEMNESYVLPIKGNQKYKKVKSQLMNASKDFRNSTKKSDAPIADIPFDAFMIELISKAKDITTLYINKDHTISTNLTDISLNEINIFSKLFLNLNYKIKKLKKGDVVECSEVHLLIYKTKFENLYKISFAIFDKMLYLEHDFIICKITSKYAF